MTDSHEDAEHIDFPAETFGREVLLFAHAKKFHQS